VTKCVLRGIEGVKFSEIPKERLHGPKMHGNELLLVGWRCPYQFDVHG